jgi:hypothetical protein
MTEPVLDCGAIPTQQVDGSITHGPDGVFAGASTVIMTNQA